MGSASQEPRFGSRLLPRVVDELASSSPDRVYASVPISSDLAQGFQDVTMRHMSQAVDYFAWWLDQTIGRSTDFETLSYMGLPDLRYAVVFLAAVKCGYKLLLPSVRNSTWMNVSLLEQTRCTKFFYSAEMTQKVLDLQENKKDLQVFGVPSLNDMIGGYDRKYPYHEEFEKVQWNPILILHSSGSTGAPKPIEMNHKTFAVADNDRYLPTVPGRKNQNCALYNFDGSGGRYFSAFPPFHLGGFVSFIVIPIYSTTATLVLGPSDKPATGHIASQIMRQFHVRALFCPPFIFEQLVQESDGIESSKKLDFLLYAGGPLSATTGNILSQVTEVCQFYGQTETGAAQTLVPAREDWASLEFHPLYGADMQLWGDGVYEMVLYRDPRLEGIRSISCNFPDVEEWHTKDLFKPHPTKPNLWQFYGRTDDIIVLSNGEKFNPSTSENIITGHPLVSGALIVGQGRFQAALLVEPKAGVQTDSFVDNIWPLVEEANQQAPGHGRIIRSMIAVASPGKSFERAGKGSIIRRMTAENFAAEIDALYSGDHSQSLRNGPVLDMSHDWNEILRFVRESVDMAFPLPEVDDDDNLYVLGLDSLKTMEIVTILRSGLGVKDTSWLSSQTLYTNPTISQIAKVLHRQLNMHGNMDKEGRNTTEVSRAAKLEAMAQKYTNDLPRRSWKRNEFLEPTKLHIALTGTTGSLGTRLLKAALDDPSISKIYCLNRSADAQSRQEKSFATLGLTYNLQDTSKVTFLTANYGHSQLGLPPIQYDELIDDVDILIHNAWKVDFNHSLESFEPVHIAGVRNLVDWSLHSKRRTYIMFISSISSVGNPSFYHAGEASVPETLDAPYQAAQPMGYGESKNVAEHILAAAHMTSGVPLGILRVGQIAGPIDGNGAWNADEWLPSLLQTSRSLQRLPDFVPDVDWIPVDALAAIILEIAHRAVADPAGSARVCNLVNPKPVPWARLTATVMRYLGPQVQCVPLAEWVALLEGMDAYDAEALKAYSALKILGFCQGFMAQRKGCLAFETRNGVEASETMAQLAPVNSAWMEVWLRRLGYQVEEALSTDGGA